MTDQAAAAADLSAVLNRAGAGESLAAIRRSLTPADWAHMLARAAVAGRFNEEAYGRFLAADMPRAPTLEVLADIGLIEPVPGRPGWYGLPLEDRAIWSTEMPEADAVQLEAQLATHHQDKGDDLEALRHLLFANPSAGLELFDRLFDEADLNLDFPRCQDILRAAQPDERSLGSKIADLVADRTAYLNARLQSLPDYYQSALFLAPWGLKKRAKELLRGRRRVWQIFGQGGLGKTMQLRWLIARQWVPRPSRTPCVRIDYDALDPVMCARYTFLTLVLIAEQLAPQLPRNPFSTLLRTYSPFLALARYGARDHDEINPVEAQLAEDTVPALFVEACAAVGEGPVVVILDTLEELSLRYLTETEALVDRLADVASVVPALRLVFAGRYAVPAVRRRFPKLINVRLEAFDDKRADVYLDTVRGIKNPRRRAELVRRSGGLPFVLALYGDLVTQDPDIVLEDVHEREPQLVYLIDRVIDRIREPLLRWLLRYGCIPRRLTRDYVLQVLAPFVVRSLSGDHTLDDPMLDPIVEWYGRRLFPTDLPDLQSQLERAWDDLDHYVSTSSWVQPAMGEQTAKTYILKAEVLAPLRAILTDRPVLQALHLESARFYLNQAQQDSTHQTRHLRDVIYHFAQADADKVTDLWRSMVDYVRETGDHLGLADLCAEITGPEYVDETGRPVRRRDGGPLVEQALVTEAHVWRAYAAQAMAVREGVSERDPRWSEVRREMELADRAAADLRTWVTGLPQLRRGLVDSALKVVEAALALHEGRWPETSAFIEGWQEQSGDIALSAGLLEVRIAVLAGRDDIAALQQVTSKALISGHDADAAMVCSALADRLVVTGDLEEAVQWVGRTADVTGQLWDRYLRLLTQRGTPELAASFPPRSETLIQGFARDRARAEAMLALRRPDQALDLLAKCMSRISDELPELGARLREQAECLGVMGRAFGATLRLDEAVDAFDRATVLWRELGHPRGELRSRRHHIEVLIHEAGDVGSTLQLLEGMTQQLSDDEESARIQLLLAEGWSRAGYEEKGLRLVDDVLKSASNSRPLYRRRAMAAVGGIVATGDAERFAAVLVKSLAHVRPVTAQLHLLEYLKWAAPAHLESDAGPLLDTLLAPTSGSRQDDAVHDLQRAYALRALAAERSDELRARLEKAVAMSTSPFLAWEVVRHFGSYAPESAYSASGKLDVPPASLIMSAVRVLRAARQALNNDRDLDTVQDCVVEAQEILNRGAGRSAWPAESLWLLATIAALRQHPVNAQECLKKAVAGYRNLGDLRRVVEIQREASHWSSAVNTATEDPHGEDPSMGELLIRDDVLDQGLRQALVGVTGTPATVLAPALHAVLPDLELPVSEYQVVRVESADSNILALPWEQVAARIYRSLSPALSIGRDHAWLRWVTRHLGTPLTAGLRDATDHVLASGQPLPPRLRRDIESQLPQGNVASRRVLIVKARREVEMSWGGYSSHGRGLELQDSYRRRGWHVTEVDADRMARVDLEKLDPLIVHVQTRLEVSGGYGWFDFSPEDRYDRSSLKGRGEQTSIFDSDLLRWLPLEHQVPVLVLDPVVPPQSGDMLPLLIARNRLAANVYSHSTTMAVMAAGLITNRDLERPQDIWLDGLEAGAPLLSVTTVMRRYVDERAPVALFAPSATFRVTG